MVLATVNRKLGSTRLHDEESVSAHRIQSYVLPTPIMVWENEVMITSDQWFSNLNLQDSSLESYDNQMVGLPALGCSVSLRWSSKVAIMNSWCCWPWELQFEDHYVSLLKRTYLLELGKYLVFPDLYGDLGLEQSWASVRKEGEREWLVFLLRYSMRNRWMIPGDCV